MKCLYLFKRKSKSKGEVESVPELRDNGDDSTLTRTTKSLPSPRSIHELYKENEHNLRVFSFQELSDATNGFSRRLKLGEGGFGSVYKGTLSPALPQGNPQIVAIKKLNNQGLQGHKQWLAEVEFLGVVNHPNIVKLLGYCAQDGERGIHRLLVYEFMPNRSLEDHLFSRVSLTLPWERRLEIMLGVAQGLDYLHRALEVQVIYRDFKPSNVLLDENFKPKLSDFGLAREGPMDNRSHVSTAAVGTYGYAAPEYVETGHLSAQSDIWSFGVVLYEILTGRRVIDRNRPAVEHKLLDWVKQFPPDSKKFSMIIDPCLRNLYPIAAARTVGNLANSCLNRNAKRRPTMSEIVETLKQAIGETKARTQSSLKHTSRVPDKTSNMD